MRLSAGLEQANSRYDKEYLMSEYHPYIVTAAMLAELHRTVSDHANISDDSTEIAAAPGLFSRLWVIARERLAVKSHYEAAAADADICGDQVCA